MTSRSEGGEGVSNFVTKCDRRGGGGYCQCDVTLSVATVGRKFINSVTK